MEIHGGRAFTPWNELVTGTTSASIVKAAETGKWHGITDIIYSTDKNGAILRVLDGTTPILYITLPDTPAGHLRLAEHWPLNIPLENTASASLTADIQGFAACELAIIGYTT